MAENEEFIQSFATNVANLVGKNLTPTDNVIEAETEELRITVIHESVASTGTCICIRKTPPVQRITPKKALEEHYCEEKVLHLLANCVKAKLNMVFCGEPGVGKTECAKFLTAFIPPEQKVITVEDTKEVHYREINPEKDCVELKVNEYFSYNDAMTEVLRMTPNRVMLSEARSTEVCRNGCRGPVRDKEFRGGGKTGTLYQPDWIFLQRRWKKSMCLSGAGRPAHRAAGVGVFTGGHKEKNG